MAYVVKWTAYEDDEPYLVKVGQPGKFNSGWSKEQRRAHRFPTKRAASEAVAAFPWLRSGMAKVVRLVPRKR